MECLGIRSRVKCKRSNLKETKERICIKTRQYAKRQTTWARGQMKSWYKIDPNDLNSVIKKFK